MSYGDLRQIVYEDSPLARLYPLQASSYIDYLLHVCGE